MRRFIAYGLTIALLAACSTKEIDIQTPVQDDVVFYASFEQPSVTDTRVYANEDLLLRWTADDRVSIFNKLTYNQEYKFTGKTGANAGGFKKVDNDEFVTGNTISHVVSVYPYQEATAISESEVISLTLPAEQTYVENTFGLGANTMVSVSSDNVLQYKNVGGYLMFKLYGEGVSVSSITLKGNNGEKFTGDATVTMPLDGVPSVVMAEDATTEITLTCPEPVALGATAEESTQFWFVIPPVTFSEGFTITVNVSGGGIFRKSTTKSVTIERNNLSKMAPIEVEAFFENRCIVYTSSDGAVVNPNHPDAFGATIISNEYKDGYGIITFDGDVTSIGDYAFYGCESLTSITIPDSVMSLGNGVFTGCASLESFQGKYASSDGVFLLDSGTIIAVALATIDGSITIPDSVTSIGDYAFYDCTSLTSITIPDSVTRIGTSSFRNCSGLTDISIPGSIAYLGAYAFYNCSHLQSISVLSSIPPGGGSQMFDNTKDCPIFIPFGSLSAYLSAEYWAGYASRFRATIDQRFKCVWSKTLTELNIPVAYNRLAYSATGALLVSDGEKVHAISPDDGTYRKAITYPGITPNSICSDDAGNVIVVPNVTATSDWDTGDLTSGSELTIYYSADPNVMANSIKVENRVDGELGGFRVRGNLATYAALTGVVGSADYYCWFGYDIQNYAVVPNYYGTQLQGPGPGVNNFWNPENAACISLGMSLHEGVLFRGYDGKESLYFLADAYTPDWAAPYEWKLITDAGSGGNENQNNLAVADYKGTRYLAFTQGSWFSWSSFASIYVFDVTDINDVKPFLTLNPKEDFGITPEIIVESDCYVRSGSADVLLHPSADCIELYYVNSSYNSIGKYIIHIID